MKNHVITAGISAAFAVLVSVASYHYANVPVRVEKCPEYEGREIVSSTVTLSNGRLSCVYGPEAFKRRR
jgi:hypothetical protein